MFSTAKGAARLSLLTVAGLIALKVAVSVLTGSISILAQAVDSGLDLVAVSITYFAVNVSGRPADREHPFGHGKVEYVAAFMQAGLIFLAAGLLIFSSVQRITGGIKVQETLPGMAVMLVSIVASVFLARHLRQVSRTTDSIALEGNAHNIAADVYSASAVLVGLAIVRFTGRDILDPIVAIGVSLLIIKSGYDVLRVSFGGLVDVKLPEDEEKIIRETISAHGSVVSFHQLRTRRVGNQRYIDLHLVMPRDAHVDDVHRICDELEREIGRKLKRANTTIHVEPCSQECAQCPVSCDHIERD